MIDWLYVGLSALWIAGLSLELVTLSIALYLASEEKQRLWNLLSTHGFRLALNLGMLLFCAGLVGLAIEWWENLLWGLLGVSFIANDWFERRSIARESTKSGIKEE